MWHIYRYNHAISLCRSSSVVVKTRIFEFCDSHYKNLTELAKAMEISVSQIYRVREGKRQINQKFIVGAMKAFPEHKLDDLFYLTAETPSVTERHNRQYAATR
jgi:hypothetical protein